MNHHGSRVSDLVIAYIGGGSRRWALKLMGDLALEGSLSGSVRLYDIDHIAAKENELLGNMLTARPDASGKWHYQSVSSVRDALTGADFVIMSIQPGTFDEMESDVHAPEAYGIYQSVGDTVGPGGIVRALRTLPIYQYYAECIREYCPDAWVINYTNPMALCMRLLYSVFPEIKAFGCCHEVFGTQELLAHMLVELGLRDTVPKREEIKINVLGLNHFTWIDQATYQGMDLLPLYKGFAEEHHMSGYEPDPTRGWKTSVFKGANRVKFDLFLRFGLMAAAGDRHLAEFVPNVYLKDPGTATAWMFRLTPVSFRRKRQEEDDLHRQRLISGEEEIALKPSKEEGVSQIKALVGLQDLVTNVNLPNRGQVQGIPDGTIVETNAVFSCGAIRPVVAGKLPPAVHSLVNPHVVNQELIVESILKEDESLAFHAFMNDPMMWRLDPVQGEELFMRMLANTRKYLPDWLRRRVPAAEA